MGSDRSTTARQVFGSCESWRQLNSRLGSTRKLHMPSSVTGIGIRPYRRSLIGEKHVSKLDPVEERSGSSLTGERTHSLQPIFDTRLFRDAITRERKRTERSGLAMVMLLVSLEDRCQEDETNLFHEVAESLSALKTDTDIMGWFERDTVMGLIVPDIEAHTLAPTCERLEAEFRREIAQRTARTLAGQLTIRLRVYPEPRKQGEEDLQQIDRFLYPELHATQQAINNFQVLKRGMDIFASILLIMLLSPLLLVIAGLIKLSSRGPVIFRQVRIGQMM